MSASLPLALRPSRPLIDWLPDETTYSLASRFHRLSGHAHSRTTAQLLFGLPRGGYPHDLPAGISHLANLFCGGLGSPGEIVRAHCVLSFYLAFRGRPERDEATAALVGGRIGSLKMRLGLPASRLGAMGPLKSCPECVEADRRLHGTPYWHRDHQLPGVLICPDHGSLLAVANGKRAGEGRFEWSLPDRNGRADNQSPISDCCRRQLAQLATLIIDATKDDGVLDAAGVSSAVLVRLQALGFVGPTGKLRAERVIDAFRESVRPVQNLPGFDSLFTTDAAAYGCVRHALDSVSTGHALRHLFVVRWLFESWQEFRNCCELEGSPESWPVEYPVALPPAQHPGRQCVLKAVGDGLSVSAAADLAGVAIATAQAWAASAGFPIHRRPSKLDSIRLAALVADLEAGAEVEVAASRVGISLSSARRVMRTHPEVLARRKTSLFAAKRIQAREAWMLACRRAPGRTLARKLEPATYAWLHRNDAEWLQQEGSPRRIINSGPRLDWGARDELFCSRIARAAEVIGETLDSGRITLMSLIRLVPDLKAKLDVLDRMPRTAKLLNELLGRSVRDRGSLFSGSSPSNRSEVEIRGP